MRDAAPPRHYRGLPTTNTITDQVPRPLGPIKGTMDIVHYLQSGSASPNWHARTSLVTYFLSFTAYPLLSFFFFLKVSIWPLLAPSHWLPKGAGLERRLSYWNESGSQPTLVITVILRPPSHQNQPKPCSPGAVVHCVTFHYNYIQEPWATFRPPYLIYNPWRDT